MSAPLNYQPAHLARPLLPVAWHARTRNFLEDVDTISAIFESEINVMVIEQVDGELLLSAEMPGDIDDETHDLVSNMCARGMDATAFICVVCGEIGPCFQRLNSSLFQRLCCEEHCRMDPLFVLRGRMRPLRSPWRHGRKLNTFQRIATNARAEKAAMDLARRYDSPQLRQFIAEASSLRARIEVDLLTNTKEIDQ